jgi:hypothetical protein
MTLPADDPDAPRPEQLAAYADGELSPPERARVRAWLQRHPEAAAELDALERLDDLVRTTRAPAPAERDWDTAFAKVERSMAGSPTGRPARRAGVGRRLLAGAGLGLAAAVALAVLHPPPADEPLPVASADDVEILSVDGADAGALVVGDLPVRGPLVLAAAGDVTVERLEPDEDGMVPDLHLELGEAATPLLVAPLEGAAAQEPD